MGLPSRMIVGANWARDNSAGGWILKAVIHGRLVGEEWCRRSDNRQRRWIFDSLGKLRSGPLGTAAVL